MGNAWPSVIPFCTLWHCQCTKPSMFLHCCCAHRHHTPARSCSPSHTAFADQTTSPPAPPLGALGSAVCAAGWNWWRLPVLQPAPACAAGAPYPSHCQPLRATVTKQHCLDRYARGIKYCQGCQSCYLRLLVLHQIPAKVTVSLCMP